MLRDRSSLVTSSVQVAITPPSLRLLQEGKTALHLAAEAGHVSAAEVLLGINAGVNSETTVQYEL